MRLAVLAAPSSWYLADLRRAAADRHEVCDVSFSRLRSRVAQDVCRVETDGLGLDAADCVLVRTMPPGSLEQVVFRMDALARLEAAGVPVVNPARAVEAAVDKYLALAKIEAAGLRVPETIACQTVEDAMQAFDALGRDVVLKPLFGSEGRGMVRLGDEEVALRVIKAVASVGSVLYLQRFIPHGGCDYRLLVIGQRVLAMRRSSPGDWRTNAARGAACEPLAPSEELVAIAQTAAAAIGASLAGVDVLPGQDGRLHTIEVNAVPGWKALGAALKIDVAALVLEHLESVAASCQGARKGLE